MFYVILIVAAVVVGITHLGAFWFTVVCVLLLAALVVSALVWPVRMSVPVQRVRIYSDRADRRRDNPDEPTQRSSYPRQRSRNAVAQRAVSHLGEMRNHMGESMITKGLVVRSPHIENLLSGSKTWEMRTRHTRHRGPLALIKKGSGMIYGVVDIIDSRGPFTDAEMLANTDKHLIQAERLRSSEAAKYRYAWVVRNSRTLNKPIPYVHRKGVQNDVLLDRAAIEELERALG